MALEAASKEKKTNRKMDTGCRQIISQTYGYFYGFSKCQTGFWFVLQIPDCK
jgi:hypothetical protein